MLDIYTLGNNGQMTQKNDEANLMVYFQDRDGDIWQREFVNNIPSGYWNCQRSSVNVTNAQQTLPVHHNYVNTNPPHLQVPQRINYSYRQPINNQLLGQGQVPAQPIQNQMLAQRLVHVQGSNPYLLSQTQVHPQPIQNQLLAQGQVPAQPIQNQTLARGQVPGQPIQNQTLAQGQVPAQPINNQLLGQGQVSAQPISNQLLARGQVPAQPTNNQILAQRLVYAQGSNPHSHSNPVQDIMNQNFNQNANNGNNFNTNAQTNALNSISNANQTNVNTNAQTNEMNLRVISENTLNPNAQTIVNPNEHTNPTVSNENARNPHQNTANRSSHDHINVNNTNNDQINDRLDQINNRIKHTVSEQFSISNQETRQSITDMSEQISKLSNSMLQFQTEQTNLKQECNEKQSEEKVWKRNYDTLMLETATEQTNLQNEYQSKIKSQHAKLKQENNNLQHKHQQEINFSNQKLQNLKKKHKLELESNQPKKKRKLNNETDIDDNDLAIDSPKEPHYQPQTFKEPFLSQSPNPNPSPSASLSPIVTSTPSPGSEYVTPLQSANAHNKNSNLHQKNKYKKRRKKEGQVLQAVLQTLSTQINQCKSLDQARRPIHEWIPPYSSKKQWIFFKHLLKKKKKSIDYMRFYDIFNDLGMTSLFANEFTKNPENLTNKKGSKIKIVIPQYILDNISLWTQTIIKCGQTTALWIIDNLQCIQWHSMSPLITDLNKKMRKQFDTDIKSKQYNLPKKCYNTLNRIYHKTLCTEFDDIFPNVRKAKKETKRHKKETKRHENGYHLRSKSRSSPVIPVPKITEVVETIITHRKRTRPTTPIKSIEDSEDNDPIIPNNHKKRKISETQNQLSQIPNQLSQTHNDDSQNSSDQQQHNIKLKYTDKTKLNGIYYHFPKSFKTWFVAVPSQIAEHRTTPWHIKRRIIDELTNTQVAILDPLDWQQLTTNPSAQFRINDDSFCQTEKICREYSMSSDSLDKVTSFPFTTFINLFIRYHPWMMRRQTHITWLNYNSSQIACVTNWKVRSKRKRGSDKEKIRKQTVLRVKELLRTPTIQGLVFPVCINPGSQLKEIFIYYCIHFIKYSQHTANESHVGPSRKQAQFAEINVYPIFITPSSPKLYQSEQSNQSDLSEEESRSTIENRLNIQEYNENLKNFLAQIMDNRIPLKNINIFNYEDYTLTIRKPHALSETISIRNVDTAFVLPQILDIFNAFVEKMSLKATLLHPLKEEDEWRRSQIPVICSTDIQLFRIQILHALHVRLKILSLVHSSDRHRFSMRNKKSHHYCHLCSNKITNKTVKNECKYKDTSQNQAEPCHVNYCSKCHLELFSILQQLLIDKKTKLNLRCYCHSSHKIKIIIYEYFVAVAAPYRIELNKAWMQQEAYICNFYKIWKIMNRNRVKFREIMYESSPVKIKVEVENHSDEIDDDGVILDHSVETPGNNCLSNITAANVMSKHSEFNPINTNKLSPESVKALVKTELNANNTNKLSPESAKALVKTFPSLSVPDVPLSKGLNNPQPNTSPTETK